MKMLLLTDIMGNQMDEVIGEIDVDLDGKFASIRTSETNLGKSEYPEHNNEVHINTSPIHLGKQCEINVVRVEGIIRLHDNNLIRLKILVSC